MTAGLANAPADGRWTYRPAAVEDIAEVGRVEGRDVALPPHFHDEDQITFVVRGRRRFVLAGKAIVLAAGQGLVIPAGRVHRSLAELEPVDGLNVYAPAALYALEAMWNAASWIWRDAGRLDAGDLAAIVRAHRLGWAPASADTVVPRESVTTAAARERMSREGFSRAFVRRHGMPPHAFARAARLNRARALLRLGEPPSTVAAEAGFADQAHLGRCFRRVFGVTPGCYRFGWSQTFKTAS